MSAQPDGGWDWQSLAATVEPPPRASALNRSIKLGSRIPAKDLAWAFDKLATTQSAGLALHQAVGMLARMRQGATIGTRLEEIQDKMSEGRSFSAALRDREREFGTTTCALIEAGESSGSLELAFRKASDLIAARLALRKRVVRAMMYPVLVLLISLALVAVMLLVVIPKFEPVYQDAGNSLPFLTRIMVSASHAAPTIGLVMLVAALALIAVISAARSNRELRGYLEAFRRHIPLVGTLIERTAIARMAATLSNLLTAGVPLLQAIDLASETSQNVRLADGLDQVRHSVAEGSTFTDALARTGAFPEMFVQLSRVGEQSGALPELMERYALTTDQEVQEATDALTTMIEPVMIVFIGGIVGVCLLGLYLPILDLGNQIK